MPETLLSNCFSVEQLANLSKINYKGKSPLQVYKRLPFMQKKAVKCMKEDKKKEAFFFFQRWLDTIEWIMTTVDYKNNKTSYSEFIRNDQIEDAKNKIANLTQSLKAQFEENKKKLDEPMEVDSSVDSINALDNSDLPLILPETPTDDPLSSSTDEFLSCSQLIQVTNKENERYLIIDVRPRDHFKDSQMTFKKCINIPPEQIYKGIIGVALESKKIHKDEKSLRLFKERGAQFVDTTILVDWNTTSDTLSPTTHISILKDILENWDHGVKNKRVVILDGGYSEWLVQYPQYTTNPNVKVSESNQMINDILESIEYPDLKQLEDKPLETKSAIPSTLHKNKKISNVSYNVDKKNLVNHPLIYPIENKSHQSNDINVQRHKSEEFISEYKKPSEIETVVKPAFDRSRKPTTLKTNDGDAKILLKLMKQMNELAKEEDRLENQILENERLEFNMKYKHSNEERDVGPELKSLHSELEDIRKQYAQTEEECNKYKSMDTIEFDSKENIEKRKLELNLVTLRQYVKQTAEKRKILQETMMDNEQKALLTKQNENNTYKEPLKDNPSINSGLERSYSSPNLLNLDRKAPQVDRSSKPPISRKQNGSVSNNKMIIPRLNWGNREERMSPVHGTVPPGITGLKNLGNSCYMNSIIQCLSNTTYLTKYFTDDLYAEDLNMNNENAQYQVVEEVAQVIKALWRGQYKSISPHDLKVAIGQYKVQFSNYDQQDSHEFLTFLLEWMHNELKRKVKIQDELTTAEKEWNKSMDSQRSKISDLFFGQLRSTITCSFCNEASTTYETFNSLTMSLPHASRCTLNECIQKFVSGQNVSGWTCPKCKMQREATKKFDFVKFAPIIVIHLSRFAESGGWLEKRNTAVDFPLIGLDLKPYLISSTNNSSKISYNTRSRNYSLYAMSNHYGTMEGGHYTAYCRNSTLNRWYKYDDQTVTEVSTSHVKSQNASAYLLFYMLPSNAFI